MKKRLAIIDLGTNTFHLLIAERNDTKTIILHREKQPVKIGLGGINQGVITDAAAQRAIDCLRKFNDTLLDWQVDVVHAMGTSALRSASNGQAILNSIRIETGIDVRLITGDEEAEYIYHGVCAAVKLGSEKSMIVDIGGGSVEFIIGNDERIFWKQSVDLGAQRLLEKFQKHDPILPAEVQDLYSHFDKALAALKIQMKALAPTTLVGSSGTFDTLSEIHCIRSGIPFHHEAGETPLTISSFLKIHDELIAKNRAARLAIPGMIDMRVDMIVVASCLICYLVDQFRFENLRVSSYSLKEGALFKAADW